MFLNLTLIPKIAPKDQKKTKNKRAQKSAKEAQNVAKFKTKSQGCTLKTKVDCLHRQVQKNVFEPDPDHQIVTKGPKSAKEAPNMVKLKTKDMAVIPKPKLIVYMGKKVFETYNNPKNSPKRPKKW